MVSPHDQHVQLPVLAVMQPLYGVCRGSDGELFDVDLTSPVHHQGVAESRELDDAGRLAGQVTRSRGPAHPIRLPKSEAHHAVRRAILCKLPSQPPQILVSKVLGRDAEMKRA